MSSRPFPRIVDEPSCRVLHAFGDQVILHLTGSETGGKWCMFTIVTPPGGGPPPHYHDNEDEWFFPIEGEFEFFVDGKWTRVEMGATVFAPRGSVHAFRNVGQQPSRLLTHTSPSGFEDFFEQCAAEFAKMDGPDMPRILEISNEHGIHFVDP